MLVIYFYSNTKQTILNLEVVFGLNKLNKVVGFIVFNEWLFKFFLILCVNFYIFNTVSLRKKICLFVVYIQYSLTFLFSCWENYFQHS